MSSLCFRYFAITLFEKSIVIHLNKLELPLPKDALRLVWLKLAQCFCWTIAVIIFMVLEKGVLLHLNKIEFPLPKDALRHVWLKLSLWVWRGFLISYMNIRYHPIGRRALPFIYTNLFSIYASRMLCAKLSQNWPMQWFWKRRV